MKTTVDTFERCKVVWKMKSRQMKKRCKNKASTVSETVVDGYYVMEQCWDGKDSILGETCNIKSSGKDDRDDRRFESAPCCASVSARFVLLLKMLCSLSHFFTFCLTILSCSRCRVRWSSQTLKVQYDKKKACTHCFKNAKRWYAFCFLDDNMKTTCGTKVETLSHRRLLLEICFDLQYCYSWFTLTLSWWKKSTFWDYFKNKLESLIFVNCSKYCWQVAKDWLTAAKKRSLPTV